MKKIIFVSFLAVLFVYAENAYSADQGWYMSGNIGMASLNDSGMGIYSEEDLEFIIGEDI